MLTHVIFATSPPLPFGLVSLLSSKSPPFKTQSFFFFYVYKKLNRKANELIAIMTRTLQTTTWTSAHVVPVFVLGTVSTIKRERKSRESLIAITKSSFGARTLPRGLWWFLYACEHGRKITALSLWHIKHVTVCLTSYFSHWLSHNTEGKKISNKINLYFHVVFFCHLMWHWPSLRWQVQLSFMNENNI